LAALNTGHEGGCGTVHANSVRDVPARLEALAALGGLGREACHAQVAAALRVVVQVARLPDGRRSVTELGVVRRAARGHVVIESAVNCPDGRTLQSGPAFDELVELIGASVGGETA